jgi:hypothetical protein
MTLFIKPAPFGIILMVEAHMVFITWRVMSGNGQRIGVLQQFITIIRQVT